jgi:hypothetical protein
VRIARRFMQPGKSVRLLLAAGLFFNLLWLAIAPFVGLFHEHFSPRSDSLRELAYGYYGERRPERFVGIALYDLYEPQTVVMSPEMLDQLSAPVADPGGELSLRGGMMHVELVDNTSGLVGELPDGVVVTYTVGTHAQEVSFVIPDVTGVDWDRVVAVRRGAQIMFVPVAARPE